MNQETFDKAYQIQCAIHAIDYEIKKFESQKNKEGDSEYRSLFLRFDNHGISPGDFVSTKPSSDNFPKAVLSKVEEIVHNAADNILATLKKERSKLMREFSALKE